MPKKNTLDIHSHQDETTTSGSGGSEVCTHCGTKRTIWTDLDLREYLGGIRGKPVSHYTTQRWRSDGSGPPYFTIAGRICHYEDEVHQWIETKRQTSTSSANGTSEIEVNEPEETPPASKVTQHFDQRQGRWVKTIAEGASGASG